MLGFGRSAGVGRGCCRWGCCTILEKKGEKEMRGEKVVVGDARKRVWLLRELWKEDCLEREG